MKSRLCNIALRRLAALGTVMIMLLTLFGCGRAKTPEEAAARHLEQAYGRRFTIGPLTRKGGGPFQTAEYSGIAYPPEAPLSSFTVWVSDDLRTVTDASYCVDLLPAVNERVQAAAAQFWPEAVTAVRITAMRYNSGADYGPQDDLRFLQTESAITDVLLALPAGTAVAESYLQFDACLRELMTGEVRIYFVSGREPDMQALLEQEPAAAIQIGATERVIQDRLNDLQED